MSKERERGPFMNCNAPKMFLGLIVAGLLFSCATASVKDTWRSPEAPATAYRKLLVVAIANDDNVRSMFENIFAETLQDHGVAAVASHKIIGSLDKADRKLLQEAAQNIGADAVIITRGVSKSDRTNFQYAVGQLEYRSGVMTVQGGPDTNATIAMSAVGIAPRETTFELASLRTNFFDTASARLLWSAWSKVSTTSRADACWDLSKSLVKALARDRLIKTR